MVINEDLIQRALRRSRSCDLESVLTTVEAYRACVRTAQRLRRARGMQEQRDQMLECAGCCRKALEKYAETGCIEAFRFVAPGTAHFVFALKW